MITNRQTCHYSRQGNACGVSREIRTVLLSRESRTEGSKPNLDGTMRFCSGGAPGMTLGVVVVGCDLLDPESWKNSSLVATSLGAIPWTFKSCRREGIRLLLKSNHSWDHWEGEMEYMGAAELQ